jgi:hypothetical protein
MAISQSRICRNAIVFVVAAQRIENCVIAGDAPALVFDEAGSGIRHRAIPLGPIELFEVLER